MLEKFKSHTQSHTGLTLQRNGRIFIALSIFYFLLFTFLTISVAA